MALADDIAEYARLIDEYDQVQPAFHVVAERRGIEWPPPEMRVRVLDTPDWVECRVLPSSLNLGDVLVFERELGIELPSAYRAYLLARYHLHDQLRATRHEDQQIFWTPVPSHDSLEPLRKHVRDWGVLLGAGYVPFAEWGDGWGPMCFDTRQRDSDGECPVVWLDHELLFRVGVERCSVRENIESLARPLYPTSREMILDVFSNPQPVALS